MTKIFTKLFLVILFLIISFIGYFSLVGFETKRFNKQIKDNLKGVDPKLDVKLNEVKIILDLFNLNINAKTLGSTISYDNELLDIELIKSNLSLVNLLNKEFSLSNLFISTKSIKLKDVIGFIRAIEKDNKTKLLILENFISKGYLIADISLNFNEQGKIKKDIKINGFVKDGSINLLNKMSIDKINFIFETNDKDLNINDLEFSYENLNFSSKKIKFINKKKSFSIEGQIGNNDFYVSEEILKNFLNPILKIDLKKLRFSSENKFFLEINDKFKILDYKIKSLLDLKEASIKNILNTKNIFPNSQTDINFKNHQAELIYQKNYLFVNGQGDILIQKNFDTVDYKIKKTKDTNLFNIKLNLSDNPITFDFLNYKIDDKTEATLIFDGKHIKDKSLSFKNIQFKSGSDLIDIDNLKLTNDFKIMSMKSANLQFTDNQDKKNIFQIKNIKENYILLGKVFNANKLINDLIFDDIKDNKIFNEDLNLKIDIKKVYLHDEHKVYDLKGNLDFKDNKIVGANISSNFNENEKINFTIITNNDQKVTTFFSDQAKPFVQKFNFIKGFEKGSLDFYSIKSNKTSNSKLKIYDFKLKKLPVLTKILTLASLQGIADLLSGEGIGFSEFEMNFKNSDKLMTINEIYAIGPAISILMEGYIEPKKLVSLRGTLVPATTINKAIGSIPIIGDILVGKKTGEGVFGVSFKIKGPPKKLESSVNPIKTLTPRFITRTLEKIKKN